MVDIRNVTNKPAVVVCFRAISTAGKVAYWVDVNAKGKMLRSDGMPLDSAAWSPEVCAKLSTLSEARHAAVSVSNKLWAERPPEVTIADIEAYLKKHPENVGDATHARLQEGFIADMKFSKTFDPAYAETERLSAELKSLSAQMASPPFMEWLAAQAIVLQVGSDDNDERSYALYRGSVWSCSRALEAEQWQLLVDRVIRSGEAELAAALAEESGTSQGRERLSPEVRRAVWTRDQGKCVRCGNRERLEFDHIVPVSRGGSNTERNVELLCEVCNRAKSDAIM
jgi:HNH endonuclease